MTSYQDHDAGNVRQQWYFVSASDSVLLQVFCMSVRLLAMARARQRSAMAIMHATGFAQSAINIADGLVY